MHFTAAKPSSCFPKLFRRKNSVRSQQSFKVSNHDRRKNTEEYIPSFEAANRSSSKSSSDSSHGTSTSAGGGGSFLMFMELRKKITIFRDFFDVPSIGASAPIHELIIATSEDLHRMYPELITSNPTANLQERNTHQGLLCFYDVLNCIAESWIDDDTKSKLFNKPNIETMPHHELLNLVVSMIECINKEAKNRFDVIEPKSEYSPRGSTNIKRSTDYNSDNSRSSDSCSSPLTPTSVLPETPGYEELVGKLAVNISPPRLLDLRAQAVQRASPVDLKRLALHILPQLDEDSAQEVLDHTVVSTSAKAEAKRNADGSPAVDETENFQKAKAKFEKIDEEIMKNGAFQQQSAVMQVRKNTSLKSQHSAPPLSLLELGHQVDTTNALPPSSPTSLFKTSAVTNFNASIPASSSTMSASETNAPPSSAQPPPLSSAQAPLLPPPPGRAINNNEQPSLPTTTPTQPPRQQTGPLPSPPPPPPSPGDSPPRPESNNPQPPQAATLPPPPGNRGGGSSMPPPPPPGANVNGGGGGCQPPPPPPGTNVSGGGGGGCQPPPPPGCGKALQKGKATKLKRSSHMGNLYRVLKGKVEGACSAAKPTPGNKRSVTSGVNAGGGNSMADALAEMTKRSSYFQQIEEDVTQHETMIKELQRTLVTFQTKDMNDMLQFHKHIESKLEILTDETQTLARFEGFPMKKLETLRMAAALYTKLKNIITDLQNWEIEPPLVQGLDKVEKYFTKIKSDMESMERTKDDEAKKFQNNNINFDFTIFTKIKEAMVDLSSDFIELALEESKEAKDNSSDQAGGKQQACAQMLWRAFQFAFKVYSFAGGQDERADNLTRELAKQIESVQTQE